MLWAILEHLRLISVGSSPLRPRSKMGVIKANTGVVTDLTNTTELNSWTVLGILVGFAIDSMRRGIFGAISALSIKAQTFCMVALAAFLTSGLVSHMASTRG